MSFFIVTDENADYFYAPGRGICRKNRLSNQGAAEIYENGTDNFGLLRDTFTHIICSNSQNDIVYIKYPQKPRIIIRGRKGIKPYDFTLTGAQGNLQLFYKTKYNGNILLFHCHLNKQKNPAPVAALSYRSDFYFCSPNHLYYTSADNILCQCTITLGKISDPTELCHGGTMPCFMKSGSEEYLVYKKDNRIFLNSTPVAEDNYCSRPVIFKSTNATHVQWKSGDFIKYKRSEDNKTWSDTIQCMGTGTNPQLINIINTHSSVMCYGYNGRPTIKII